MHARFRAISSCTCLLQLALGSCHSCESAGQQFPYSPSPVPLEYLAWICYDAVLLERIWGRPTTYLTYLPYLLLFQPLRLSTDLPLPAHPLHSSASSFFIFFVAPLHLRHLESCLVDHSFTGPPLPFPFDALLSPRRSGVDSNPSGLFEACNRSLLRLPFGPIQMYDDL